MKKNFDLKEKTRNNLPESVKSKENKNNIIEDLKVISCINHAVNTGRSLKEIIKLFSDQTKKLFSSSGATVYLLSKDKKFLVMQNYTTPQNILRKIESAIKFKIREVKVTLKKGGFYFKVLEEKKPLILSHPRDIKKAMLEFVESIRPKSRILYKSIKKLVPAIYRITGINSVMIVPLIIDGGSIGVIDISSKKLFKESDLERIITFSGEIAAAINRKLVEDELDYTSKELNTLLKMTVEGIRFIDTDLNVLKVNKGFCEISGVDEKRNLARKCYEVFFGPDCNKPTCVLKQILEGAGKIKKEVSKVRSDKRVIPCILTALPLKNARGKIIGVVENFNDISEIKKVEESILKSKKRYRELAETLNEIIIDLNPRGRVTYANKKAFDETGYTQEDVDKGLNIIQVIVPKDKVKLAVDFINFLKGKELKKPFIYTAKRKDGTTFPAVAHPNYLLDDKGKVTGIRVVVVDISDIEKAEEKVRESKEKYRLLFENSLDGIYRTTLEGKYIDVNPSLVKMLGYGSRDELLAIDIPTQLYARKEDRPGPDQRNKMFEAWLKRKDGSIIVAEINSRVIYEGRKPVYYDGIVRDVTKRKAAEENLKESYQKLRKVLDDVINTLAAIVEVKDPYTSGHQKRVAMLAVNISKELGLDEKKIDAINIAALIHDIGKINLPASVLTRPGRLSKIEYDMVKTHPKLGYDMVDHIEFPKPVADIVLQHHERIDGSGYPQGLKGDEIIPEARIIAVADVVEAMSSHRPYRPALGIGEAVKEIKQGKGKLYDPRVVNACVRFIKRRKFDFKPIF